MLAELVGAPVAAIRRWHRQGALRAVKTVRRLPYFDFQEVATARRLSQLLAAGCSLQAIERRLAELQRLLPAVERPLAESSVVVEGRRVILRRGDDLAEPGGQLLLDFDAPQAGEPGAAIVLRLPDRSGAPHDSDEPVADERAENLFEQLQRSALDWEDEGRLDRAAEAYRTILMAIGPRPEIHFALADVLYRAGDLSAARERYYAALELDEEYVEARASLGCLLAETGQLELAAATFEGALAFHPDFADVYYHLANTLQRLGLHEEAETRLRQFLELAPESPWAVAARDYLGEPAVTSAVPYDTYE